MAGFRASLVFLIIGGLAIHLARSTRADDPNWFSQRDGTLHETSWRPPVSLPALEHAAPPAPYVDFDSYLKQDFGGDGCLDCWHWQILPRGLVFRSYLAGTKESRFAAHIVRIKEDSTIFEGILGARVGLLRYGTSNSIRPEGFQIDAEGSGQVRLDIPEEVDVRSVDFRAGVPVTYGIGPHRLKFAYYHLSSHVGDEFLAKNLGFNRLNFARDVLVFGYAHYVTDLLRFYGEAGWAFYSDVSMPWEFQFGFDYFPSGPTGIHGAPFLALNAHLREEVDFGGALTVQAGWAWRGNQDTRMLRAGLHYYNGKSNQFSFFDNHENQVGFGLWYDF